MMGKLPPVERGSLGYGLNGESAYVWALFLKNEADMEDDQIAYSKWTAVEEQLRPAPGKPMPASVHIATLEDAIKRYTGVSLNKESGIPDTKDGHLINHTRRQ